MRKRVVLRSLSAVCVMLLVAASARAQEHVPCPSDETVLGLKSGVRSPWWSTDQSALLRRTLMGEIGGRTVLQCEYRTEGGTLFLAQRYPPDDMRCEPERQGFTCFPLSSSSSSEPLLERVAVDDDCVRIRPERVRILTTSGGFRVDSGGSPILTVDREAEARRAIEVIRHYGLDQYCTFSRGSGAVRYFLRSGGSPEGSMPGEDCVAFDAGGLAVAGRAGSAVLVDGHHYVVALPRRSVAERALEIIRHHGFDRFCFVGRPNPEFTYFRR